MYNESETNDNAPQYLIPHFHGFTFAREGLNTDNEKKEFLHLLETNRIDYYNQMVLKNAVVDYTTLKYKWRKKLIKDFYLKDHKEILETQINNFYDFWQAYINTYKTDTKNLYFNIQNNLEKTNKYRDYWFLNPQLKSIELTKENKQKYNYSPFVAMSKLPRHAVKYALSDLSQKDEKCKNEQEEFLGAVIITLDTPKHYEETTHYDALEHAKLGNLKIKSRYKYQTEVDFLSIKPTLVFPIIKPAINKKWKLEYEQKYCLTEETYNNLQRSIISAANFNKMQDKLTEIYQTIILNYVKSFAQVNKFQLVYQTPDKKLNDYSDNIMSMQKNIFKNSNPEKISEQKQNILQTNSTQIQVSKNEETLNLKNKYSQIYNELETIINLSKTTKEAIKTLSETEKEGMEQYETVCLDKAINILYPKLSRPERDEILATHLDEMENKRKESFVKKLEEKRQKEEENQLLSKK
jgi:hypothetical protein